MPRPQLGSPRQCRRGILIAASATARINVEQASYVYHRKHSAPQFTLEATTFQARERELVAILGPNASGKSTLLKLVVRSHSRPFRVESSWTVSKSAALTRAPARSASPWCSRKARSSSPYAPETTSCRAATRTAARSGLRMMRITRSRQTPWHKSAPNIWRDRWVHEISGGEKQRVVLARALAQQPLVLLLDEPTLHLDIGAQVELLVRLRQLAEGNRYTVIIVTHELGLAAEFADQHRAAASRQMFARGPARRRVSARIARASLRDAARNRERSRGPPARSNSGQEVAVALSGRHRIASTAL